MITPEELLERVRRIATWKRSGERAPHKPLLTLFALGRLEAGLPDTVSYPTVDQELGSLLVDYGPPRASIHPEYPFWRLQRDGLWVVHDAEHLPRRTGKDDPLKSALIEHATPGGFPPDVLATLRAHPELVRRITLELLQEHFPPTIHEDLLSAVGLPPEWATEPPDTTTSTRRKRRAGFRSEVLEAYGYACAICGFDVRLGHRTIALDAAHIRWHQADGPDEVTNGLALCTLHHRALDHGVIGLTEDLRIQVSAKANGSTQFARAFLDYLGQPLRAPHSKTHDPRPEHVRWHGDWVFKGPSRTGRLPPRG